MDEGDGETVLSVSGRVFGCIVSPKRMIGGMIEREKAGEYVV